jgi:PAS domain S-box-containing protein/putative nucleotidyltransferase with HDIG domain
MKNWKVSPVLKFTVIYTLIGGAWVLFSDQIVEKLFSDPTLLSIAQTYKDWLYLAIAPLLLFTLIKNSPSAKKTDEHAEKRYRMLVEKLPAVIFMDKFNDLQTSQYISPRIKDLLGYTAEEWVADDEIWKNSLHPEDKERVIAEDARTNQTGDPFNIEYRLRHRDGHYVWIKENASVVRSEDGDPVFWQGILSDITQQKQIEQATQRQLKELTTLHAVALAETTAKDTDELIQNITDIIGDALYPDNCGVYLLDEIKHELFAHFSYRGIDEEQLSAVFPSTQGVVGKVASAGKSIRLGDVSQEPIYYEATSGIKSELCVPIINESKVIGVINVESRELNAFTESDERLLNTVASGMGNFIKKIQLFELEQKRRKEAEILREATGILTSSFDLEVLFENIFVSLAKLVIYDSASIEMINHGRLEIVAGKNIPKDLIGKKDQFNPETWDGINNLRQPVIIPDVHADKSFESAGHAAHIHSWMRIPLFAQNNIIGFLNLNSHLSKFFNEEHAAIAQAFANQAAIVMENARLFQEESRRSKIIEAMADIASESANTQEVIPALDKIAQLSLSLLNAGSLAVYLLQDDNKTIKIISAQGDYQKELLSHTIKIGEGITGNIIAIGKPEIVEDMTKDPRRIVVPGTPEEDAEHDTMMSAPLILHGKPMGAINAWRKRASSAFDKSELNFLINIAHQVSVTIESAHLFQEATRRAQEAAAIAEVGRDISATLHLDVVLERIAIYAKDLLKAGTSAVYLAEPDKPLLRAIAAIGVDAEEIKNDPVQQGEGIIGSIASQKHGEIVNKITEDPRTIVIKGTGLDPYEHIMGVPVFSKEQLTGLLVVWRSGQGSEFKISDLEFLSSLAQQAAVAIGNARLFELEQKRREEAETVRRAATALTDLLDIPSLYNAILDWLYKITPYDSASILEIEGDRIHLTAARGLANFEKILGQTFPKNNLLLSIINETGEPLIVADCEKDSRFEKWGETNYVRGWMGIPLISRGQMIGFITIDSRAPNAYTQNDAIAAQTFAHQAATSIENTRLFTETRQRLSELEIISRVSFSLRAAHDTKEMFPILLSEIKSSINTDSVAIWLYDPEKNQLEPRAASGQFNDLPKSIFKPDEGIIGKVYSSGISHVSDKFFNDPTVNSGARYSIPENRESKPPFVTRKKDRGAKSTYIYGYITAISKESNFFGKNRDGIIVPIRTASNTIGALAVAIPAPRKIETHHIRLVTTLAEIAGNAIYRSNLYERGEKQISQLTTLRELDSAIASSMDLRITLNILVENMITKMNVDAADVLVFNPNSQMLEYCAADGFNNRDPLRIPIGIGDELTSKILLSRQTQYISDIKKENNQRLKDMIPAEQFTSYYAIPLFSKGATRGILETYFRAPFSPATDWEDFMRALAGQATIAIDNAQLFENLQHSNQELSLAYDTTLEGWGKALELRDKETEGHTRRVTDLALELARHMGIPETELLHIRRGALLHDIGKMGVPDNILRKKGPLTKRETVEMHRHPQYAYDLLSPITYLRAAIDIAYCHHEWWDGSGYPRGIKGEAIPLPARIFAIVDVWDALLSDRPYRAAWTIKKTLNYIKSLSGKQFDPHVVDVFSRMIAKNPPAGKKKKNK